MRRFSEFAVFDWSGQAIERPKGIALATLCNGMPPLLNPVPDIHWSRSDVLNWLHRQAERQADMLIGFDLSMGFPFIDTQAYFPGWASSPVDATGLWALVEQLCSDDPHFSVGSFVNHPELGRYFRHQGRLGDLYGADKAGRMRIVERESRVQQLARPYSCLNLVGAAQVGKSSLTGMRLLHQLRGTIPVWPFDPLPAQGPVIVEIYTSIAARAAQLPKGRTKIRDHVTLAKAFDQLGLSCPPRFPRYDDHSTDALLTTAWLSKAAENARLWQPKAMTTEVAQTEGWTFGVF